MINKKCETAGVTLIGIGGCGMNMMISWLSKLPDDALCIGVNRDNQRLSEEIGITHKVFLDVHESAKVSQAEMHVSMKKEMLNMLAILENRKNIILLAGMGGATGTWVSQFLCNELIAKGKEVVTVLVMPFGFEGERLKVADEALAGFDDKAHQILCFNNSLIKDLPGDTSFEDALEIINEKSFELIFIRQ